MQTKGKRSEYLPCRNSNGRAVICPLRLRTLEDELCKDLRDLIVRRFKAVLTQRVGGFDGSDHFTQVTRVCPKETRKVSSRVGLSDCEYATGLSAKRDLRHFRKFSLTVPPANLSRP